MEPVRKGRVATLGWLLCVAGAALGSLGLLAWAAGVASLTSVVPTEPRMTPNTAMGLVVLGIAAAVRHREGQEWRIVSLLGALGVLALGAGTLAEYAFHCDLHLDPLLLQTLPHGPPTGPYPGRPSPPTALALTLISAALLLYDYRPSARVRPSECLLLGALATAFVALVGFVCGAGPLYRLTHAPVTGVAMPTAVGLLLISLGSLLERPDGGVMRVVTSPGPGGTMLRRLLIPALLAPVLLGPAIMRGLAAMGVVDLPLTLAVLSIAITAVTVLLLTLTATALNRAHAVLESSRAQLHLSLAQASGILSISADAIISLDDTHRITAFNEGAERIFGYSRAEMIGTSLDRLLPERFRAVHRHHLARFTAGEMRSRKMGDRDTSIFGLRNDGTEFPADAAISKLQVNGTTILTVALRDITAAKRAHDQQRLLSEAGALLVSTLEYDEILTRLARLAVREFADMCSVDAFEASGEVRTIQVVTRDPSLEWACEILRATPPDRSRPHEVWSILQTHQPILMASLSPEMADSFAQDNPERMRAIRAIGPKSAITVPLLAHGNLIGMLALVSSTPSRRYGDEDVRVAQALALRAAFAIENSRLYRTAQRALQAREEVLGIVAHDLRNPLNSIVLHSSLLSEATARPEVLSAEPAVAIQRSAMRMNRMIQDLLDVACVEAGRLRVSRTRVSTSQVIYDAVEAQRSLAAAVPLELKLELADQLPEVWADHDRLLQVFENLVGNAIKFTGPSGVIAIGAKRKESQVLFWVADTGAGIADDDLPHVFDRFWQARNDKSRGAGLGLTIVQGIIEAHGGHIWVESSPGRGTTFFFTIPISPQTVGDPERAASDG